MAKEISNQDIVLAINAYLTSFLAFTDIKNDNPLLALPITVLKVQNDDRLGIDTARGFLFTLARAQACIQNTCKIEIATIIQKAKINPQQKKIITAVKIQRDVTPQVIASALKISPSELKIYLHQI